LKYLCHTCGKEHDELPDIGADVPDNWYGIPADQRAVRVKLTGDTCVIDDAEFYVRGVLQIPLTDSQGHFGFGVWISQSAKNFQTYLDNFDTASIGPFFGWLSTRIGYYPVSTISLKTKALFQGNNQRPLIELEPTDHPLSVDCRRGISIQKAWEIVHYYSDRKPEGASDAGV
jgi:hypothetical protein